MSDNKNRNNNKSPRNSNNTNLNLNKDPSSNEVINPFLLHLHDSNRKKNLKIFPDPSDNKILQKNNNQRDINEKNLYFNMKFNSLLNEIRHHREENKEKLNKSYTTITNSLDKSNNLAIVPLDVKKGNLNNFLKSVTDKYNLLYENLEDDKKDDAVISRWGDNYRHRRSSTWIPALNPVTNIIHSPQFPLPPPPKLPPPPPPIVKKKITINREINGLSDILKLIDDYPLKIDIEYNIDMKVLHNIDKPLRDLNAMIGMHNLKDSIVDQVIYFLQGLDKNNDFMHTVIYGPPGTGKTEVAKIMGAIFSSIGILNKNTFKKVTRADLIAGYLGQTAIKTKDVIKDSLGGVLFIDEAYALGNSEKKDSFAKECIDTLCESLSDHKSKLMVIIAGYKDDLNSCFFAYNQGLDSRFPWRFHTDDYTAIELKQIFVKKIKDIGWSIATEISPSWFETKMAYFKFYGRDMETLLAKTKIAHGRRVFCQPSTVKTIITKKDLDNGFEMFTSNDEVQKRKNADTVAPFMYI